MYIRINIVTLGCAKNIYDSEVLMGYLKTDSIQVVNEAAVDKNDIVIINTCGFINDAKQESIDTILEYVELKNTQKIKELIVIGCLSERYKEQLKKEIPEVDTYFGLDYLPGILKRFKSQDKDELIGERVLITPKHYAYLKISDGCNHKCSFCAIPSIKGAYKSNSIEENYLEVEKLSKAGVKEIILIAQDTTYYGMDLYGQRKLADLLDNLCGIDGIEWIRLQYAYPVNYIAEVVDKIKRQPKICNYLDIPFQHISDNMLKIMRRGINKDQTLKLIDKMRNELPGIALRTTFIVGHPGETDKDFEELLSFIEGVRFERLGVFSYSHEEGTHSYKLKDDIPLKIKDERVNIIMNLQKGISNSLNLNMINKELKVIIDRKEGDVFIGRTEFDTPEVDNEVIINNDGKEVEPGQFCKVKIIDASEYDLVGKLL